MDLARPAGRDRPALDDKTLFAGYGGSSSCAKCHQKEFELWSGSHHARAERPLEPTKDATAFTSSAGLTIGVDHLQPAIFSNHFYIITDDSNARRVPQEVARIIGVSPLWQALIAIKDGRIQATEAAYDPGVGEWFDVYGRENRRPGEWGHWTGRGMNWNSMCAACHNTRLRKNYREDTDAYQTAMAEAAIGCEACHGPMAEHNRWQQSHSGKTNDPSFKRISRDQMFSVCGSCHSRRQELTGDFAPGENFFDHYVLSIPDETETFFADGQIHDEDYEFTAFMGSRMHQAGVRCADCHEPHTSKLRVPGNAMCQTCHGVPGTPAPKIDPQTHSRHATGTPGDQCVNCHMPQTTYMQRHGRHDHGFTVPDPLLTRELGVPNACGKCHADKSVEWAIQQRDIWPPYGHLQENRARARNVAFARTNQTAETSAITKWASGETNAFWRAVATGLLRFGSDSTKATEAEVKNLHYTNALVRVVAAHALEGEVESGNSVVVQAMTEALHDPIRAVRVEAAWTLRRNLGADAHASADLRQMFQQVSDQPGGALQNAVFHLDQNDWVGALQWFERAINWDTNSAGLHEAFAVALSMHGEANRAVTELETACRLEPKNAEFRYKLALGQNELGDISAAQSNLEEAVRLEPKFVRAWYNLGLIYNSSNQVEKALDALSRAESLDARMAELPYARATVLLNAGRQGEARAAARRALEISPDYAPAKQLLESIGSQ
jgi:Tfp pilus assembly protein PilF